MARQQKHPPRELTAQARQYLEKVSRSQSESGRRSGDVVGKLVARFNAEGIAASSDGSTNWAVLGLVRRLQFQEI